MAVQPAAHRSTTRPNIMPPAATTKGRTPLNTKKAVSDASPSSKKGTPRKKATPRATPREDQPRTPEPGSSEAAEGASSAAGEQAAAALAAAAPAAAAASSSNPTRGSRGKGKKGDPPKKEEKNKMDLSFTALKAIADTFDALAQEYEEKSGSLNTLESNLGEVLEKKVNEGMKNKDFFEKMDKNGDGKISRMEFRQAMRDLGFLGDKSSYNAKDVDELFGALDKDSGGDLDMHELSSALKGLRLRAKESQGLLEEAKEKATYWRERAQGTREAAEKVELWEQAAKELVEFRANPSPESKVGTLIVKRGLKPADVVTALTADEGESKKKSKDIDEETFAVGIIGLGVDATREELGAIFQRLDADGG